MKKIDRSNNSSSTLNFSQLKQNTCIEIINKFYLENTLRSDCAMMMNVGLKYSGRYVLLNNFSFLIWINVKWTRYL